MNSFFRELVGGVVLMIVASLTGIAVNAVRPGGVPLIQQGTVVETVQHGDGLEGAVPDTSTVTDEHLAEGAVSLADMKSRFDAGASVIIDARSPSEYEEGHIPGSLNIPHDRIPEFMDKLTNEVSTDADVICYCRGPSCEFSDLLATELKIIGYERVSVFSGGWEQWSGAGYPTETGPR